MSGPIVNLATGEILIPDDDLSPEENEHRRRKMLGLDDFRSRDKEDGE